MSKATLCGAVASVLLIAGCSQALQGNPSPRGAGAVPAGLADFYAQQLSWEPCASYTDDAEVKESYSSTSLECAKVTVPIDYERPDGSTARIAIMRKHATGAKIGSLLVNPGGPGGSGLEYAASIAPGLEGTELGKRFDLVGFDPRGIGASTPQIRCRTDAEIDDQRDDLPLPNDPAGIAKAEQKSKDLGAECASKLGTEFLAHVGTRDVVKDMDVIRAVLGDKQLTYLGISYGTRLGSTYAETFPQNVRALVLDGALDPAQNPVDEIVAQNNGFQKAFDAFAADCAKLTKCPLGNSPELAVSAYRNLLTPLLQGSAPTDDPRGLSYGDAVTGTITALYSPDAWRVLRIALTELAAGRGDVLLRLADLYDGRSDAKKYNNSQDAFTAIRCVDGPPQTDRSIAAEADRKARVAAPFVDDGRATGAAPLGDCAFWPVPNTLAPHTITAQGLPKVVVVSTTGDPATPYQSGVNLARDLKASLITYQGTQHGATLSGVACVDDAVTDYLINLRNPADGFRCGPVE